MSALTFRKTIAGHITLDTDDEDCDFAYLEEIVLFWSEPHVSVMKRSVIHDGCSISVAFDWMPVGAVLQQQVRNARLLRESPDMLSPDWWEKTSRDFRLNVDVEIDGENSLSESDWYPEFFVENALYDIFTIANLALPSAADFFALRLESTGRTPAESLELSAYYLDQHFSRRFPWPAFSKIDVADVDRWYMRIRNGVAQIPDTPVERAIFALLHVCRSAGRPEDIVWLFYGFESLFQSRAGENFSALVDRIALILHPTEKQSKYLKKQLREMYDLRSSFVHGGLQVIHPAHHDAIDPRIDAKYSDILALSVFGTRLLVACLQRYAKENWNSVSFKTLLVPDV